MKPFDLRTSHSQLGENGANDQAQLLACLLCCFDDFNLGPIVSCFGYMHEDYFILLTCLKVQIQEGPKCQSLGEEDSRTPLSV